MAGLVLITNIDNILGKLRSLKAGVNNGIS